MKTYFYALLVFIFSVNTHRLYSQNPDIRFLEQINHIDAGTGFNNTMLFITHSAPAIEVGGVLGMGFVGWLKDDAKLKEAAWTTGLSLVVNQMLTSSVKFMVNRPRPMVTYPNRIIDHGVRLSSHSFPSGHTSSAFAFATSLTLACPKWYIALPAYVWASSVAFSRMYFGVHYPSDVLGGIVLGVGSAYVSHEIKEWYLRKYQPQKQNTNVPLAYAGFIN